MKYKVKITVVQSEVVEVDAESKGDALDVAYEQFYGGDIFLTPSYPDVEMEVVDNDGC